MISAVKISVLVCCLRLICQGEAAASVHWSYDGYEDGPAKWPCTFPTCGGHSQSPVNIDTRITQYSAALGNFTFDGYDLERFGDVIENDGHSVKVTVAGDTNITVSGGGLPDTYTLLQYHFHWGSDNYQGSEHTVNGRYNPMEVHLVHQAVNSSGTTPNSQKLAVLGVLFEIGNSENTALDPIFSMLGNEIKEEGEKISLSSPVLLDSLLPTNTLAFHRYNGSLTTPPCSETVVWTVFRDTVKISQEQMNKFRHNLLAHNHTLHNNYRPLQLLRGRKVLRSFSVIPSSFLRGI